MSDDKKRLSRAKGHGQGGAKRLPDKPGRYYYPGATPAYEYEKGPVTYKTANGRVTNSFLLWPVAPLQREPQKRQGRKGRDSR